MKKLKIFSSLHLPAHLERHAYEIMKKAPITNNINSESLDPISTVKVKSIINRKKAEKAAKVR